MVPALLILTVVAFIGIELILIRAEERRKAGAPTPAAARKGAVAMGLPSAPADVFLDPGHTWVRVLAGGLARVGLDDFLAGALGRVDRVELPPQGRVVGRGEPLLTLWQGDRSAVVRSPLSGAVVFSNEAWLAPSSDRAGDLAGDPYGAGWLCEIQPTSLSAVVRALRVAEDARDWLRLEVERFRELLLSRRPAAALGTVLPDGGLPARGVLEELDRETWDAFVAEFLARS